MKLATILSVLVFGLVGTSECKLLKQKLQKQRRFPSDFLFGVGSSAYQIEGGWNADGKGENIWDHQTHTDSEFISDGSNGDIAADTYHNYKRDVEMIRELGLDTYRFSLSWSRILPTGFDNHINEAGVAFYNNYINELLKHNIKPMVTLYYWDLPQKLQDLGGFANPLFADWFEDYARVVFKLFGDRVKFWITFIESKEICYSGYGSDGQAPRVNASGIGDYLCAKHLVLAHAKAYHLYNKDFRPKQKGEVGISFSTNWAAPYTNSKADEMAAELERQASWAICADPIFSAEGGFPIELTELVAAKSAAQGYSRSRLPTLTEEEIKFIKGASDFFGLVHYTGTYISATEFLSQEVVPSLYDDIGVGEKDPDNFLKSASSWLTLFPRSLYKTVTNINHRYGGNTTFYVTENGWSSYPETGLIDNDRITYFRAALEDVLDLLDDGVNLKGYTAWSLMDNFEWTSGYTERFGLYEVDFESAARTRTPRKSAFVYKHIVKHRVIDHEYQPNSNDAITIDKGH